VLGLPDHSTAGLSISLSSAAAPSPKPLDIVRVVAIIATLDDAA
jgi:hypothetical protein